jgi:ankyrin repeat protein
MCRMSTMKRQNPAKEGVVKAFPTLSSSIPSMSPSRYLAELFSRHQPRTLRLYKRSVTLPREQQLKNYTVDSVRAVRQSDVETLRALLKSGHSFDACNNSGETLLHLACRRSNEETVRFLLCEARVPIHGITDDMGRTPLHEACWRPTPSLSIMVLLFNRFPPEAMLARDSRGHTPFDYVRREDWSMWLRFLRSHERVIERRLAFIQLYQDSLRTQREATRSTTIGVQ